MRTCKANKHIMLHQYVLHTNTGTCKPATFAMQDHIQTLHLWVIVKHLVNCGFVDTAAQQLRVLSWGKVLSERLLETHHHAHLQATGSSVGHLLIVEIRMVRYRCRQKRVFVW